MLCCVAYVHVACEDQAIVSRREGLEPSKLD